MWTQRRVEVAEFCVFVMVSSVAGIPPKLKSSQVCRSPQWASSALAFPFFRKLNKPPDGVNVTAERPPRALAHAGGCRSRGAGRTQVGFQEEAARVEWAP